MPSEIEVEIKIPVDDMSLLRKKISQIDTEDLGVQLQKDVYFDHPCRSFESTDEALRIREIYVSMDEKNPISVELTYKGPKIGSLTKSREETSVEITLHHNLPRLLNQLGFTLVGMVKKNRQKYGYDDVTITLDHVEGLGDFIEFEKIVNTPDVVEKAESDLFRLAKSLGLDSSQAIRLSYLELLLDKF
ncbi:MAG: hypothetical protein BAJATHORv1_20077 [Candidatus Thorarchaeota archaeon]|nr:MAG: hypothetical protein BAJATHORv1_20077 [Candidatus Thorarchaeota archaeon]